MTVSIVELKAKASEMVARAEAGEKILVTRHGKIVAELRSLKGDDNRAERIGRFQSELALLPKPNPPISSGEISSWIKDGHQR